VAALLKAGADPDTTMAEGEPALLSAARAGSVDSVKALLDAGADIAARERFYGQTAVMWAAIENHAGVIAELAARGADVNARAHVLEGEPSWRYGKDSRNGINGEALQNFNTNFSKGGLTALMYAARQGATDAARMLIDKGANTATTDPEGFAPLHIAIMNAQFDTAAAVVEKGADVNQPDRNGQTPLFALVDIRSLLWTYNRPTPRSQTEISSLELTTRLLDKGAVVDAKLTGPARRPLGGGGHVLAGRGATPFLRAAVTSDLEMMRLLLDRGADPAVKTANGHTALHAAAGLRWNETTMSTAIALGFATEEDSIEAIKLLIARGLDVNGADNNGFTAMHGAAERGANALVRFLFEQGGKLDVTSKPSVRQSNVDNEPPLNLPGQTPYDSAMDADPPQPETAAVIRELMGLPPETGPRAPRRTR
jgi:ankyrin repeat protein